MPRATPKSKDITALALVRARPKATPKRDEKRERVIAAFEIAFRTGNPGKPGEYGVSTEELERAFLALRSPLRNVFYGAAVRLVETFEQWRDAHRDGRSLPIESAVTLVLRGDLEPVNPIEWRVVPSDLAVWLDDFFEGRIAAVGVVARMLKESMSNGLGDLETTLTPAHTIEQIAKNVGKWRDDAKKKTP